MQPAGCVEEKGLSRLCPDLPVAPSLAGTLSRSHLSCAGALAMSSCDTDVCVARRKQWKLNVRSSSLSLSLSLKLSTHK